MNNNLIARIFLAPFAILYGIGVSFRNLLYSMGLLRSNSFNLPVINVGNLSVGGSGKTPHVEYLIRLLKPYLDISTLSRGYKRQSKGFLFVDVRDNVSQVGDEPLMFKRKNPDIVVAVSESRTIGIPLIVQKFPSMQAVLLDDAFQHRSVNPGLNILVTEYDTPFFRDYLLPVGRLREWRTASERADILIVSKCPENIDALMLNGFREACPILPHQKIFFTRYSYGNPYYLYNNRQRIELSDDLNIVLLCAIANTEYLLDYLDPRVQSFKLFQFEDHHQFTERDIGQLKTYYETYESNKKIIITTEKDAMRLDMHRNYILEHKLPIFVLPIEVTFIDEEQEFQRLIKDFLLNFKV